MAATTKIASFAINTSTYTPIVAPIPCNFYLIIGNVDGSAMMRSSDGTDASAYTIPAGGWYSMVAPMEGPRRFSPGDIVTYIKALSGVGPVVVEFLL